MVQKLIRRLQAGNAAQPQLHAVNAFGRSRSFAPNVPASAASRAAIILIPNSSKAHPTCVGRLVSTLSPRFGVTKSAQPGRCTTSKYALALNHSRNAAITLPVDSASTSCALVNLARRIVQNRDQLMTPIVAEPVMTAAIDLQRRPRSSRCGRRFRGHLAFLSLHRPRRLQPSSPTCTSALSHALPEASRELLHVEIDIPLPVASAALVQRHASVFVSGAARVWQ